MPILPLEPMLFPEDLFVAPQPDSAWWVLHTKPRTEKALGRDLLASGIPHFLPQYAKRQKVRGRDSTTHLPLFTGYLFLHGNAEQRSAALRTDRVANCLAVPDQAALHEQLAGVCRVVTHDPSGCGPHVGVAQGDPVEVTEGPFAGLSGRVIRVEGGYRFVVGVLFLQQSVEVTLGHWAFRAAAVRAG